MALTVNNKIIIETTPTLITIITITILVKTTIVAIFFLR